MTETLISGPIIVALVIAFVAGVVSFASPCVLPLAPGYLSYVTGLSGADVVDGKGSKSRMLLGSALFVAGFSFVFVSYGVLFGSLGSWLMAYQDTINRVLGVLVIVLGLGFMGIIPGLNREWRMHAMPKWGIAGAPLLGLLFGLGWTPCIGPTLTAVQGMAFAEASAARGALLSLSYSLGIGLPFILLAVAFNRMVKTVGFLRRNSQTIMRFGGAMLVLIGVMLVTGWWNDIVIWMRIVSPSFEAPL